MILYFDLCAGIVKLCLIKKTQILYSQEKEVKSDKLLQWFDQVLKKEKLKIKDIKGIVLGPVEEATFSASRGITNFVNVLGFSLGVPVVKSKTNLEKTNVMQIAKLIRKSKVGVILSPEYSEEPNITAPRREM